MALAGVLVYRSLSNTFVFVRLQSWSGNTRGTSTALLIVGSFTPDLVVRSSLSSKEALVAPVYGLIKPSQVEADLLTFRGNVASFLFWAVLSMASTLKFTSLKSARFAFDPSELTIVPVMF